MATTSRLLTYEEWLDRPEIQDGIEEVVNGEIRIIPPNKWKHTLVVERLRDLLRQQLDPQETLVVAAPFGLIIRREPLTSRVPELAVFRRAGIVERDGYIHSAPELVVEVLSPGNTRLERSAKLQDYSSVGVPEVWVLSPEARTVEVLLLESSGLRTARTLSQGEVQSNSFPRVKVEIATIWPI